MNLNDIPNEHKKILKKEFVKLSRSKDRDRTICLYPLEYEGEWFDYVFGYVGSKLMIKAFKEPNRMEESSKALFELGEIQAKGEKNENNY